jgi:hypothetical protein
MGIGDVALLIFNLSTRWRWIVRFTPWPLYPWKERHRYTLERGQDGPQGRSGAAEETEVDPQGNRTPITVSFRSLPPYRLAYGGSLYWRSEPFQTLIIFFISSSRLSFSLSSLLHNLILLYILLPTCVEAASNTSTVPCESYKETKMEPGAWGYNWGNLSLGNINTGAWSSRLGVGRKADDLAL